MSILNITRGEDNVIDCEVQLPDTKFDWDETAIEFTVRPRRLEGDIAPEPAPDEERELVLLRKSTNIPPGGVELIDDHHVRINLTPADTLDLPQTADGFHWTLRFEPGGFNAFVLDSGLLEMS